MIVYGENASLKVNKLANDFNRSIDDDENKIYVSSNDSLEYDAIKYFSKSLNQIIGESNLTNYKQNQSEQTLAIIKPDAMSHRKEIIKMITDSGLIIRKYKVEVLSADLLREHYAHVAEEPFYPSLESYMSSGPVVILLVEGENAVKRLRDLVGPTDSRKAPSNTIRGKFGTDAKLNAIHASDSIENAEKEINRFFKQKSKVLKLK
jgi:nucleoside-diphosphate kinase